MSWTQISSFDEIPIDLPHTLVICDIDDTLLYFPGLTREKYTQVLEHYNSIYSDPSTALEQANGYWTNLFTQTVPTHTDLDGFARLLLRLHLYGGGICFVTARPGHESNIEFTKSNFAAIRLSYDAFVVHYSWIKPKGEYIREHIDLTGYTNIIFIDDMEHNLSNVNSHFGSQIKCYKFVHNKNL